MLQIYWELKHLVSEAHDKVSVRLREKEASSLRPLKGQLMPPPLQGEACVFEAGEKRGLTQKLKTVSSSSSEMSNARLCGGSFSWRKNSGRRSSAAVNPAFALKSLSILRTR